MVLDESLNRVQTAVDGSAVVLIGAEVLSDRLFLVFCYMQSVCDQLLHALILRCGNGDHRNSEHLLQSVDIYRASVAGQLIHHIECDHHRPVHLKQLHRKIKAAFDTCDVNNVYNSIRLFVEHKIAGDHFLTRIRRHGIDARQIGDACICMPAYGTVLPVDCDSGEIAHMLVRAGQLVEECGLSAVLVSDQGKGQHVAVRQRLCLPFYMVYSGLAQSRMFSFTALGSGFRDSLTFFDLCNADLFGISESQSKLIAPDPKFHRITHRRELDQFKLCSGDDPHIQKMLS